MGSIFKQSPLCLTIILKNSKRGEPQTEGKVHLICHLLWEEWFNLRACGANMFNTIKKLMVNMSLCTVSTFLDLKCLDGVLVLEVPDEDLRVATPTDQVAAAVQETAAGEAPSFLGQGEHQRDN